MNVVYIFLKDIGVKMLSEYYLQSALYLATVCQEKVQHDSNERILYILKKNSSKNAD